MNYFSKTYLKNKFLEVGFKKYLTNTSWLFGTRIISMIISFLATTYVARNLGPANFGELSYALSFVGLFGFVASLGIDGILYRDLIKYPEQKETLLGTAFYIKLCAGIIATILTIIFAAILAKDDVSRILIIILSGTFTLNAFQIITYDFQSRVDSKYPSFVSLGITFILNVLKVFIIMTGKGVIYLALTLLLESILYATLYILIYEKKTTSTLLGWKFDKEYAVKLIKDSSPLIVLSAFSMIYARIDQVLIKSMIDSKAVGFYDSAVRVAEVGSFVPGIIVSALYPAIVNAKQTSDELYTQRLKKLAILLFILALCIAIPIMMFAPYIIKTLYGNTFIEGVPVLKIYIWANIGTFLGILVTQYLTTENFRKILSFVAFVPMLCNVALNILWIPEYGIVGAAYATLISYSLMPLSLLLFKQTRDRVFAMFHSR